MEIKGEVNKKPQPTKARVSCISQETWWLADRREALQQAQRESTRVFRQAQQEFQISLQGDRQRWERKLGETIEALLATD